jgi:hypothetical protein
MTTNKMFNLLKFQKCLDRRGNLSVIEGDTIPFDSKRILFIYDVPSGSKRRPLPYGAASF